jgi:hypothetical protein
MGYPVLLMAVSRPARPSTWRALGTGWCIAWFS